MVNIPAMKKFLFAALLLVAGCATPMRTIKFDSDPPGAHVFVTTGANKGEASKEGRNYLGTTPFSWTTEVNGDGSFKMADNGIPFYNNFVRSVVVFTAEPPGAATNLFTRHETFKASSDYQKGAAPDGVFFDMTRPDPPDGPH
jgi:hypothetical protein